MTTKRTTKAEARRLAVLAEAEALGVPGFMTPTWRAAYGRKSESTK